MTTPPPAPRTFGPQAPRPPEQPTDHGPALDLRAGEPLLRKLELTVRNRLDGLLQGNYLGLVPGPGSEAGEARQYVLGDDVRRMDWPVTARTTVPHIRQTVADRELETWIVVDLSPSMDFGTGRTEKRELVLAALTAVTHLTVRGGNRVGALVGNGADTFVVPARAGHTHARHLVNRVAQTPRADRTDGTDQLTRMLESLRRPPRRRGLVAVVSDFMDGTVPPQAGTAAPPLPWERALRALAPQHQLLGVEVLDPRELELPNTGLVTFVDTETGREVEVQTADRAVRENYANAARAQRQRIATSLRHAGASHLQLRTDRDWVSDIVRFVIVRRHTVTGSDRAGAR